MRISDWSSDVCSSDLLDALHFAVQSGRLQGFAIEPSEVAITGLSTSDSAKGIYEQLTIEAKAVGPAHDALAILDHPRLDLLSRLGMAAEGSAGTADATLAFQFPLKKDLDFDDVSLQVAAQVTDGALRHVFLGQDMKIDRASWR